jgi:hypothetical protein
VHINPVLRQKKRRKEEKKKTPPAPFFGLVEFRSVCPEPVLANDRAPLEISASQRQTKAYFSLSLFRSFVRSFFAHLVAEVQAKLEAL